MTENLNKNILIKNEKKHFKSIFSKLYGNKLIYIDGLLDRLAWCSATVMELQDNIKKNGVLIESTNSDGITTLITNPSINVLNDCIESINYVMGELSTYDPEYGFAKDDLLKECDNDEKR